MPRAMLALAVLTAATLASLGTTAAAATGYSGPNAVAIPYLGEIVVKPAPGWTVADCAAPLAAPEPPRPARRCRSRRGAKMYFAHPGFASLVLRCLKVAPDVQA